MELEKELLENVGYAAELDSERFQEDTSSAALEPDIYLIGTSIEKATQMT